MRGLHAGVFGYAGQQSTPRTPKIKGMAVTPPCGLESAMDKENVDVTSQSKDKENVRSEIRRMLVRDVGAVEDASLHDHPVQKMKEEHETSTCFSEDDDGEGEGEEEEEKNVSKRHSTRYADFSSIHELVEDTIMSAKKGRGSDALLRASLDLDSVSQSRWNSGYIPKQFGKRRAVVNANRRSMSSLRSSISLPLRESIMLRNRQQDSAAGNQEQSHEKNHLFEEAIGKVHKGLDMVLGKQNDDLTRLINQIYQIKTFWKNKRPETRINSMADLIDDIKLYTESLLTKNSLFVQQISFISKENKALQSSLKQYELKANTSKVEEKQKIAQLSNLKSELEIARATNQELQQLVNDVSGESKAAMKMLQDNFEDEEEAGCEEGSASLPGLVRYMLNKIDCMQAEQKNFDAAVAQAQELNLKLASELEEQKVLVSRKEQELKDIEKGYQEEAMEVEGHYVQVEGLVKKIEDAEQRMREQANLCTSLQGQISHLKCDHKNSIKAKNELELLQEQWKDEKQCLLEEIEGLKLESKTTKEVPGESQHFLTAVDDNFRECLLDLFELLDDPSILKESKDLVACLARIKDSMPGATFDSEDCTRRRLEFVPKPSPSKKTFDEKVEYFDGIECHSEPCSFSPTFNSPRVIEGIKARMNMEQKRQAKLSVEIGEKISEATDALKGEFQKHITSYKARIEELEQELSVKTNLLHERHAENECPKSPLSSAETYDLSFFPEEWENQLLNIMTQAALCPVSEWRDMLLGKEHMIKERHACHVRGLMERLKLDFQDEAFKLKDAIASLERDLQAWNLVSDQGPLDLERRVILQQKIVGSMHRLQVLNQLASLSNTLLDSSDLVASNIYSKIGGILQTETTESDVDNLIFESWNHALNEMKRVSKELTNAKHFQSRNMSGGGGASCDQAKPPPQRRKVESKRTVSFNKRVDTLESQKRSATSTIPRGGSFMNFSPGLPFYPGEREANLKMGQPSLKEILGPKSPTEADIKELVEELLDYFKEEETICHLIRTIEPCREKHLEGSYRFGTRKVKLVILNDLLMVRIGGGFETFESFFTKHFRLECFRLKKEHDNCSNNNNNNH